MPETWCLSVCQGVGQMQLTAVDISLLGSFVTVEEGYCRAERFAQLAETIATCACLASDSLNKNLVSPSYVAASLTIKFGTSSSPISVSR